MKKNIFNIHSTFCILLITAMAACRPQAPISLDPKIDDLRIVVTPDSLPNTYILTANPGNVIGYWDLGNGAKVNGASSARVQYPSPGNYTVTLNAYGSGGKTNIVSIVIPVLKSNYDLLKDSIYTLLTGGINNPGGKVWVVDSMITGHLIKNPQKGGNGDWAALPADGANGYNNRANNKYGAGMYDDSLIFKLTDKDGFAFEYRNHGTSCAASNAISSGADAGKGIYTLLRTNGAWQSTGAVPVSSIVPGATGDYIVYCTPPKNMGWSLLKDGAGNYSLIFSSGGGFLSYFTDWSSDYQVKSINADKMVVWKSCSDGATRQIVLCRAGFADHD
ncbi:PKD domain-containing protein [Pinibacter soli]|uniref:PKD domain-containing protein n=1 Tax=Pinibacter soli TaxID=3044211 RepID=A0ABT6REX0_9BACT|nr:PKD domain-containing protein [Pinibacter soli]MDI3320940.1 PKD domain-containing protein [Pinibacter soli]